MCHSAHFCYSIIIKPQRRLRFPGSYPPSMISAGELNYRVREGNGCDLSAIATEESSSFSRRIAVSGCGLENGHVPLYAHIFSPYLPCSACKNSQIHFLGTPVFLRNNLRKIYKTKERKLFRRITYSFCRDLYYYTLCTV